MTEALHQQMSLVVSKGNVSEGARACTQPRQSSFSGEHDPAAIRAGNTQALSDVGLIELVAAETGRTDPSSLLP